MINFYHIFQIRFILLVYIIFIPIKKSVFYINSKKKKNPGPHMSFYCSTFVYLIFLNSVYLYTFWKIRFCNFYILNSTTKQQYPGPHMSFYCSTGIGIAKSIPNYSMSYFGPTNESWETFIWEDFNCYRRSVNNSQL
jgi:hypothetical protein